MTKIEAAWMPPRPARLFDPLYGEHKRVREGISGWGNGKKENKEYVTK